MKQEQKDKISRTLKRKYANGLKAGFQKGHPCYSYNLRDYNKKYGPWNKGITGKKSHSFGRKFTKERKLKISKKLKGNRNAKGKNWKQKLTLLQRQKLRKRLIMNLKKVKKKETSIELIFRKLLEQNNIEFKSQYPVLGKYLADFYIKPNIIIEADGDYWHKRPDTAKRDKKRDAELLKNGYQVIRFWEKDIKNNLNDCWDRLQQSLVLTNEYKQLGRINYI